SSDYQTWGSLNGLVEVWRHRHSIAREHSFHSQVHDSFSRIDLVLLSSSLLCWVEACSYLPCSISDHSPLKVVMDLPEVLPPDRRWRLNPGYLAMEEFVAMVGNQIDEYLAHNGPSSSTPDYVWEALKATLWGHISSYSVAYKKKKSNNASVNIITLALVNGGRSSGCPVSSSFHNLQYLKYEFNKLMSQKVEFALFWVQQSYFEAGKKASKLLAYRLQKLTSSNTIHLIKNDSNRQMVTNKDINLTFKQFYSKLYTSESVIDISDINTYLVGIKLPCMDPGDRDVLEAPIS
uniref:Endonuclease/exonuclease/phosphatase domain-containing protein n=1 Tax=Latimeria chalumnae TaxID=7897 RepID=H2ZZZ6_LATCH